jgi:hypothetical protein
MEIIAHLSERWSGDTVETLVAAEIKLNVTKVKGGVPHTDWTRLPHLQKRLSVRFDSVCGLAF